MSKDYDWSFFDDIKCINLYSRPDRYQEVSNVFQQYKIPGRFYRTHKHPMGGRYGCFESHLNIIREAYDKGYQTCLIFEDDMMPSSLLTPQNLEQIVSFMRNNQNWNIFLLGSFPEIWYHRVQHIQGNIYRLHAHLCHAYVVHRRMMEKMYYWTYSGLNLDMIFNENNHAYGFCPSLFYQRITPSDIDTPEFMLTFRYNMNRLTEMYAIHINIPLFGLLAFVTILWILIIVIIGKY